MESDGGTKISERYTEGKFAFSKIWSWQTADVLLIQKNKTLSFCIIIKMIVYTSMQHRQALRRGLVIYTNITA